MMFHSVRGHAYANGALMTIAAIAICAGIFFRVHHLDHKVFWGDEIIGEYRMFGYTEADIVRAAPGMRSARDVQAYLHAASPANPEAGSLRATIRSLATEDPQHPPFYYLLARLWSAVAGDGPAALRTLPMIFGILSIGGMAWLARELFGDAAIAAIAAAIYAVSPFAVLYSQEAREYSLWALEALVLSATLLRAARTGSHWLWICYGAGACLSLYTYPLTLLVMLAHALAVLACPPLRRREVIVPFVLAGAGAALTFLPWVLQTPMARMNGMHALLSQRMTAPAIALEFMRDVRSSMLDAGVFQRPLAHLALKAGGAAVLAAFAFSLVRLAVTSVRDTPTGFLLALFLVPALPFMVLHGGALLHQIRYFVPCYLVLPPALAAWIHAAIANRRRAAASACVAAAAFALILLCGVFSCMVSAQADTWYNKAYETAQPVAAVINRSERPLVIDDQGMADRGGTSPILELAYYLQPDVAVRANLHCEVCDLPPPPRMDVFADASQYRRVFIMGKLDRPNPLGDDAVQHIGVDIDPRDPGSMELFAPYPR
jgi:uncharacterized membrane protein